MLQSYSLQLKLFDRKTGRYIREIGHTGIDPKACAKSSMGGLKYWVDDEQKIIYFFGWHDDFIMYDLNGHFKGKIKVPNRNHYDLGQNYYFIDSNKIWGHNNTKMAKEVPSVFYIDKSTKCITNIFSWENVLPSTDEIQAILVSFGHFVDYGGDLCTLQFSGDRKYNLVINSPSLWKSDNTISLKQAFNDTIYNVTEKGLTPYKVFGLGKWHWNQADQFDVDGCDKKIAIDYVLENDKYFYFHFCTGLYLDKRVSYCGFYNKKTQVVSLAKDAKLMDKKNEQDIRIRSVSRDGSFVALLLAENLSENNMKRLKVGDEDNPVVVIAH